MPFAVLNGSSLLDERRQLARQARDLGSSHVALRRQCRAAVISALEICEKSWSLWDGPTQLPVQCVFFLRAVVDGTSRLAIWRTNRLLCHPELADRAEVVIRLGETFKVPELGRSIAAGLDEPLQAALTLMRAADAILELQLRLDGLDMTYRTGTGGAS